MWFDANVTSFMPRAGDKGFCAYKRLFILTVCLAVIIDAVSATAQPLKEIRIGSSNISVTNICTYYARDRKFFEREGLDVKIIIVKTEAALPAVVAGNLDYTTLSTSSIEATLRGMPLRLVAVTNQQPLVGLVVREGIKQVTDLKGKKLSVSSFGGATYGAALYLLKSHGLRPKEDVTILAAGTNVARIAALKQEAVDAILLSSPDDIRLAKEGFKILVDIGTTYKLLWGGVSTTLTKIRENPAEVKKVVRAVVRATKSITEPQNKEDVIDYLSKFFKLDKKSADEFYQRLVPSLSPTGMVDRDKIKLVIDSAVERGLTDKPLDPEKVVDFSFAKELYQP
ncbi:MAG TPA: ABC transporter substrate-binding protein [Candidatus Binatia bacterium]|nr:ABC transporter substrate-binding protein [Candidatus Binatia bacterium]